MGLAVAALREGMPAMQRPGGRQRLPCGQAYVHGRGWGRCTSVPVSHVSHGTIAASVASRDGQPGVLPGLPHPSTWPPPTHPPTTHRPCDRHACGPTASFAAAAAAHPAQISEILYSPASFGLDLSVLHMPKPKARIAALTTVVGSTLWLLGGTVEVGPAAGQCTTRAETHSLACAGIGVACAARAD